MTDYIKPGSMILGKSASAIILPSPETQLEDLMLDRHRLHYLALCGKDMRRKQTRYFRTKDPKAKQQYLKAALYVETCFDKEVAAIIAGQPGTLPHDYIQKLLNPQSDETEVH